MGVAYAFMVAASVGFAIGEGETPPPYADLYYSPTPESGLRVPPSGAINILSNKYEDKPVSNTFAPTLGDAAEISNTLGCSGIGQSEFTSGLFNMPETFQKFQKDVNSTLSKDLLSLNFVMPQTSALFDQLNNIGNQRFDQFQRGCNVTPLQQDAKQNYMMACVEKLTPERETLIKQDNDQRPEESKIPANQIGPMAYAQAWEVCGNQFVSNTTAMAVRSEKLKAFYETTRQVERVDQAIRPYLCGTMSDMRTGDDKPDSGCWAAYLIPQVRSCLGEGLKGGCTSGDYGVRQPVIPMPRLFDTFRFIMEDELVARRVVSLTTQLSKLDIDASTLKLAASDAVLKMSAGTIARNADTTLEAGNLPAQPRASVRDFQLDYLNCKNIEVMSPVQKYVDALVRRSKKVEEAGLRYTNPEFTYGDEKYMSIVNQMDLPKGFGASTTPEGSVTGPDGTVTTPGVESDSDKAAFTYMLPVALGCTVNQSVPIFDPNILVSLQTQCSAQDRAAFYSVASYDVALQATRDVYRYLGLKLKQTYARLLTEAMVPVSDTTSTAVSPTLSPELNNKFAAVVKDVMIPYVESQIERIDELSATRGAFGQRVSEIYRAKNGCMNGNWLSRDGVRN